MKALKIIPFFIFFIFTLVFPFIFTPNIYTEEMVFPEYSGYVNDYAGVLDSSSSANLENLLAKIDTETSAEIAVVIIESLEGITIEEYTVGLFKDWGIGKKGKDNGILMLASTEDRAVRIEVGYGLESVITDLEAGNILDDIMIPNLREGNFYSAFYESALFVGDEIYKEYGLEFGEENIAAVQERTGSSRQPLWFFLYCFFPFFGIFGLVIFLVNLFKRRCPQCRKFFKLNTKQEIIKKATYSKKGEKIVKRVCEYCGFKDEKLVAIPKLNRPSFWSGSSKGSSSGGSGFGGFGGGSSGGGGASGKW